MEYTLTMAKHAWWMLLVRGLALVLLGFVAIAWPGLTLVGLSLAFVVSLLISGVMNIVAGMTLNRSHGYWFLLLALGIVEIGLGIYTLKSVTLTVDVFVLLLGFLLIVRGLLETVAAFDHSMVGNLRILTMVAGILSLVAGVVILRYPLAGGLAFAWVLGAYALIAGAILLALAVELKAQMALLEVMPAKKS